MPPPCRRAPTRAPRAASSWRGRRGHAASRARHSRRARASRAETSDTPDRCRRRRCTFHERAHLRPWRASPPRRRPAPPRRRHRSPSLAPARSRCGGDRHGQIDAGQRFAQRRIGDVDRRRRLERRPDALGGALDLQRARNHRAHLEHRLPIRFRAPRRAGGIDHGELLEVDAGVRAMPAHPRLVHRDGRNGESHFTTSASKQRVDHTVSAARPRWWRTRGRSRAHPCGRRSRSPTGPPP